MKSFQKTHASSSINTKNHWAVGTKWTVEGSTGSLYTIKMLDNGFQCDCPAFKKCKHIGHIEGLFDYDLQAS